MTDISVIKMIISVAVWRIYPSWVNDRLRTREGLGHSGGMLWARLSRDDFRSKLEIISFLSRVMFIFRRVFFCFPRFCKIWRQTFELWGIWFRRCLGALFETCAPSLGIFLRTPTTTTSFFFEKKNILFSKQSRCYLPDSCSDPQAEQSPLVMVHRKVERKLVLPSVGSSAGGPSIVVANSTSRLRWFMVQKRQKPAEVNVWLPFIAYKTSEFWGACFRDPMFLPFCSLLFSWMWMYSSTLARQAADWGQRRKAVICDISGVGHGGVTNLSAPCYLVQWARRHCTVFRHVMQLSLLVLCLKSTLTVILPKIRKKKSLSNIRHQGTKAENLAWQSTG